MPGHPSDRCGRISTSRPGRLRILSGSGGEVDTSFTVRSVPSGGESEKGGGTMVFSRSSSAAAVPHNPAAWPLIGREEALADVAAAIVRPGPGSLVLAGPSGVGRSRLAREALGAARSAGFSTEWFVATRAAASIPFGAFARLLDGVDRDGSDRLTLFLCAVEVLAERAKGRRLVLGVDDAHLLDQAGAALLHQVAATGMAFVVATVCAGEPAPEPVAALGKGGLGTRLEVRPLAPEQVERLLG